ncbi:hypothetical protein [Niabella aurantiaca]|uniref:hypothetical protein n=1 Tax=Niabella aurantiaca TaxID=379900 RepID=UPI000361E623|nr:hypothetical protein [Niabella aurantiaca]
MNKPAKLFLLVVITVALFETAVAGKVANGKMQTGDTVLRGRFSPGAGNNGSWLPRQHERTRSGMNAFLKRLKGSVRLLVTQYDNNLPVSPAAFDTRFMKVGGATWRSEIRTDRVGEHELHVEVKFKLLSGEVKSGGVALAVDFDDWAIGNYVFAPAIVYGGNRFKILPLPYPPYIDDPANRPLDMPVTTTNILHLNKDGAAAKIEMNTGNLATPMMGFFNPKEKTGFLLLTEQASRFGNNGMIIEENAAPGIKNKRISFIVSAPGVRNEKYVMCGRAPSGDKAVTWKAGDEIGLRFHLYNFSAADMPAFFEKAFNVRKALSGQNSFTNITPFSVAGDLIVKMHNRDKWFENDRTGYYCNHPGSNSPYGYQIGWSGLPVYAFPQLTNSSFGRLDRVVKSFDNILFRSQAATGLFYAANKNGEIYGDPHGKMKELRSVAMTRRSMEVLCYGLRSLELFKKRGQGALIKPHWEKGLRNCADGLLQVWKKYGQFGQFIDVDNLEMNINGSAAGGYAGAGLALAAVYFNDKRYLELAKTATKYYYEHYFLKGYAGGAPAEILQAPDSEAYTNMLEACMVLFDVTADRAWIEKAKFIAHGLATFMVSYDYKFPAGSAMQMAGVHAAGSIFASAQNNHSAPGYYIMSGDMLLKLYRATGDKKIAELYRDQTHNVMQYVGAPYNPLRKPDGFVSERVQLSDWEGNNAGEVDHNDSNMAWETLVALSAMMNPGIYLHTDDDTFLVLDHVNARVLQRKKGKVTFRISNPTQYDATVSVFSETSSAARRPLVLNRFMDWPRVHLKAGEAKIITVAPAVPKDAKGVAG